MPNALLEIDIVLHGHLVYTYSYLFVQLPMDTTSISSFFLLESKQICDQILENLPFRHKQIFWENSNKKF